MIRKSTVAVLALGLFCAACKTGEPVAPPTTPLGRAPHADATHEFKKVAASADYPLATCLITGEELGPVDDRVAYSYDGTEVQFCCPGCAKTFQRDPDKYLAKLAAAK